MVTSKVTLGEPCADRATCCAHTCVLVCECSPKAGCFPSAPPPQSRPPESCFPGAHFGAPTSPLCHYHVSLHAVRETLCTRALRLSLLCQNPSQCPSPSSSPDHEGHLSPSSVLPAQASPRLPVHQPGKPCSHPTPAHPPPPFQPAHVSPTSAPFPSPTSPSAPCGVPVECFCLPHESPASGKQALVCLFYFFVEICLLSRRMPDT